MTELVLDQPTSGGNLPVSALTNAGAGILMMQGQYLCTV